MTALSGCVDAPITPDQLESDGMLRSGGRAQAAFSAQERAVVQPVVQVSAVLAAEAEGALEDRSEFSADVTEVHLHLRADGLLAPRPVVYRWTHDDVSVLIPGMLAPTGALTLASSSEISPDQVGKWEVEVLTEPLAPGEPPQVLVHREFEVKRPS